MNYPLHITLCGFGGQGIILSAVILGTAAVTKADLYAVQTQSYGSEARGGQCQSELIIDNKPINSPVAATKDILVALFQDAYNKYIPTLRKDGLLVIDPGLVTDVQRDVAHIFEVPATQIAVDLGNRMCANMVTLGFLCECTGMLTRDQLLDVVLANVPERFADLNRQAVDEGIRYAKDHNLYCKV